MSTKKTYHLAVCIKRSGYGTYLVEAEIKDEYGAMLLAQLLKEHDPEVSLMEIAETEDVRHVPVRTLQKLTKKRER
jgi:hypothetical protein